MASRHSGISNQDAYKKNQAELQKAWAPLSAERQSEVDTGRNLRNQISKAKLENELNQVKGQAVGGSGGSGGLGQPIGSSGGSGSGSGISGIPKSMAELEAFSDRAADKNLERQKKAWGAAAGFRNTEDLREHGQAVEMQGRVSADEQRKLGMSLGSQEKITGMTEGGQTQRLGMSLGSQKDLTKMTETGQTNRLGMQLGSQEKITGMSESGQTNRLGMQIGSQERMQKSGFDQDYKMTGYQQELGERTKQQDATRAAKAFKQF